MGVISMCKTQPCSVEITNYADAIVGVCNTQAGGNSSPVTQGGGNCQYYNANQSPMAAIDDILSTKYLNFGSATSSTTSPVAGVGTGFYVTPVNGATLLSGIVFVTADDYPARDPLTITVEGSNNLSSSLTLGSSWTLMYNGSTGLDTDPGRNTYGIFQAISATISYTSYRVLITSQRGTEDSVQYSEAHLISCSITGTADASMAYYSFDNGSFYDSGSRHINGTGSNAWSIDGRLGQALNLVVNPAYFTATGFTWLGASNRAFSIALWINPVTVTDGGTIIHVGSYANGGGWCMPFIGFQSGGQIVTQLYIISYIVQIVGPVISINKWTHIVQTYSPGNGMRMYINGILFNSTGPLDQFQGAAVPMTIYLGNPSVTGCVTGAILEKQVYGAFDEFYVYSRELTL
ncbi:unnamed protein product, partial [Didymodactylos carnosus]